jgi:hypothetical protein
MALTTKGKNILRIWIAIMAVYLLLLQVLDHWAVTVSLFGLFALETLSFLITVAIARRETSAKNKVIFLNFSLVFGTAFLGMIGSFITSPLFPDERVAKYLYDQFTAYGAYVFFLTFSIGYLTIDVLFRDFKIAAKYAVTLAIVGGLFVLYFHPFIADPMHCYHTQDIRDWKTVDSMNSVFVKQHGYQPSAEELAGTTQLYVYEGNDTVAVLQPEARVRRVTQLLPYLVGDNFGPLATKPIMLYVIQMSVAGIIFTLLFFGYLYMKDPPQGAYIEKIMFLWLVFCSMEVLHGWGAINAVEWKTLSDIFSTGQYASNVALLFIAVYLSLRLRFISSIKGEFYEQELSTRPTGITRWRDTLDNMVVESFFNRQTLMGRLFAVPEHQQHQHSQSR